MNSMFFYYQNLQLFYHKENGYEKLLIGL